MLQVRFQTHSSAQLPVLDVTTLYDPRPLEPRHKLMLNALLAVPVGRVVQHRDFFDAGISLADLRVGMTVLRRALKMHNLGVRSYRKRGYALYKINNSE